MVESYANSVEDKLIEGLTFKLEGGASYINDRKFCTFHPQGSNYYSPSSGSKLIKIALTGKDWLDPTTFRVAFDVVNDGTYAAAVPVVGTNPAIPEVDQRLRPLSGPWCMLRRVRLLAGGQVVEDVDYYSRVHEMFDVLTSTHSRINESVEGFGRLWDEHAQPTEATYLGIRGNDRQTVCFKPLLGLLNQTKFLPLQYLQSLSLELELVDNAADSVVANVGVFDAANNSLLWHLENVQVKCDMISLDNGVQESYHNVLMSSKDIPIHYNTLTSQFQTIIGQDEAFVNVSRAATRLKSVFVTLDKSFLAGTTRVTAGRKWWNDYFSPASDNNRNGTIFKHSNADEFELTVQIGSKIYPDYPIRSHSEAYYNLRKTLGVQSSSVHSFDIKPQEYHDNRLIMAIDTEKSLGASFTGINTRSGDLMTVKFKYKTATDARKADRIHIVLHTDNIMKITGTGVEIFD